MKATRPRRVGDRATRNLQFWRYWLSGKLIVLAMWVMPRGRYRTELHTALWTLHLKVQAYSAAKAVRDLDNQHRVP